MTELRSCIFIDQLQPQTLAYLASWMRGTLPRARMAAQVIEISPGLDIELRATTVQCSCQRPQLCASRKRAPRQSTSFLS